MILKNVLYCIKIEDEKEPEQKAGSIGEQEHAILDFEYYCIPFLDTSTLPWIW